MESIPNGKSVFFQKNDRQYLLIQKEKNERKIVF